MRKLLTSRQSRRRRVPLIRWQSPSPQLSTRSRTRRFPCPLERFAHALTRFVVAYPAPWSLRQVPRSAPLPRRTKHLFSFIFPSWRFSLSLSEQCRELSLVLTHIHRSVIAVTTRLHAPPVRTPSRKIKAVNSGRVRRARRKAAVSSSCGASACSSSNNKPHHSSARAQTHTRRSWAFPISLLPRARSRGAQ